MDYFLIGKKLGHSWSPQIHQSLGYDYGLKEIPPEQLEAFMKAKKFKGINITIPYKKEVMPFCDTISQAAQKIGCVNTIRKDEEGGLHGYNTDYYGFLYMAESAGIQLKKKKVLLLGDGATSLTARAVLEDQGAGEILLVSRNGDLNYQNMYQHQEAEVIINTTPVGMYPQNGPSLVDLKRFPHCCGVLDVIYNPLRTNLLLQARELNINSSGGLPMLAYQGVKAGEIFLQKEIPAQETKRVMEELRREVENIVLIGMPGCGKTTVGKEVAKMLQRSFVDLDQRLEEREGRSIPEIFLKEGEEHFRQLETALCQEIGKEKGLVIATGGGAVLRKENVRALRQNGRVYWLQRDLELLERKGRPLSRDLEALRKMAKEREPHYHSAWDEIIPCTGTPKEIAHQIAIHF